MGISVVIPVYNTQKYLEECLESTLAQNIDFDRIIIINDGSTDNSLKICEEYTKKYKNIILVSQKNQGQGVARNLGLNYVDSEYVMFLDSDDYLSRKTVEVVLRELEENNLDILYFDSEIKNELSEAETLNYYHRIRKVDSEVVSGKEYFKKYYPRAYVVQPCMVAFKKEYLTKNNIRFPECNIYEDAVFSFIAMLQAKKVKYIPEKLYVRRYRLESTMTRKRTYEDGRFIALAHMQCWNYMLGVKDKVSCQIIDSFRLYLIRSYREIRQFLDKIFVIQEYDYKQLLNEVSTTFKFIWNSLGALDEKYITLSLASAVCGLIQNLDQELDADLYSFLCAGEYSIKDFFWDLYKNKLTNVLRRLPLSDKRLKVGIYGIGNHTNKLLQWFQYLIGDIVCELYFIDTYSASFEIEYNKVAVINVCDANKYVDTIVLSSITFEEQMYHTVRKLFHNQIKMSRFYNKEKDDILIDYCYFI